jgi:hypothetical protein
MINTSRCAVSRSKWTRTAVWTALAAVCAAAVGIAGASQPAPTPLPLEDGSVRFAVIGDMGTGKTPQREVAAQMAARRAAFPFEFVLTVGDNIYGSERPADKERKFALPFKALLDAGVKFYASLGNHDEETQTSYPPFNMNGRAYYSFTAGGGSVLFVALDTVRMTEEQRAWAERTLRESSAPWKIVYHHHVIYSSGIRHGSDLTLRKTLEPVYTAANVTAVFQGHDHFYERTIPQQGIVYFVTGAGGKLRKWGVARTAITAQVYALDRHFMLVEIAGDQLHFQAVSRTGAVVDSGVIPRRGVQRSGYWRRSDASVWAPAPLDASAGDDRRRGRGDAVSASALATAAVRAPSEKGF